jgi:hypothetical protein
MKNKSVFLLIATALATLTSVSIQADAPRSYDDIIRAERARMIHNYQNSGGDAIIQQQKDDSWLTNTPATWGYIINKEKQRMHESLPHADAQPSTEMAPNKPNLMPTTINEGVRLQHEQMQNRAKDKY